MLSKKVEVSLKDDLNRIWDAMLPIASIVKSKDKVVCPVCGGELKRIVVQYDYSSMSTAINIVYECEKCGARFKYNKVRLFSTDLPERGW